MIAIDDKYNKEYREALYKSQTTDDVDELVQVFKKCQIRFDEKIEDFDSVINQVENEEEV